MKSISEGKITPLVKTSMDNAEIEAVTEVIRSGWVSHGENNKVFEREFADYIGVDYGIAVSNCFAALYSVLVCSNITGEVLVPSFTFGATVNAIHLAGAKPVFVDVDYDTRNVKAKYILERLTPETQAIIIVHYGGQICEMDEIMDIVKERSLLLIEDSAQTIGSTYKNRQAGSFGVGCFSFYATKNISTGEGGLITLSDSELHSKLLLFISHGINRESRGPKWKREVVMAGMNLRLSQINAAIGVVQLRKLNTLNKKRREIALKYNEFFTRLEGVKITETVPQCIHVYQMYTVCVEPAIRDVLVDKLNRSGIMASVHFDPPVHMHSYYKECSGDVRLMNTEKLSKEVISIPIYPGMREDETGYVCTIFENIYNDIKHGYDQC